MLQGPKGWGLGLPWLFRGLLQLEGDEQG